MQKTNLKTKNIRFMEKQLTITGFPAKEKYHTLSIPQKANIVYWSIIDKMPKLYEHIMNCDKKLN